MSALPGNGGPMMPIHVNKLFSRDVTWGAW